MCLANARLRDGQRGFMRAIDEAINDFKMCENVEEVENQVFDGLGQCFHVKKRYIDAIDSFNFSIKAEQNNADFLIHRANCRFDLEHFDDCISDLEAAIKINEHDP